MEKVAHFYEREGAPVKLMDLRLLVAERDLTGRIRAVEERDGANGVVVDFSDASLLNEIDTPSTRYRVADYDPRKTDTYHGYHKHKYVVHRQILESDVIVSIPKLKTHEKVGATLTIKGFVGTVAHKDSLAHHRFGSPAKGGDEYPYESGFLTSLSRLHERIYGSDVRSPSVRNCQIAIDRNLRRAARLMGLLQLGAWHGNDTAWRMALDLAQLVYYADAEGKLHDTRQRTHLSLVDGIIGGEGEGPLAPSPVRAGALVFGSDVPTVDLAAARLMGFDSSELPIVSRSFTLPRYAIAADSAHQDAAIIYNGRPLTASQLRPALGRPFRPPRGWADPLLSHRK
jgi:hypothetical protein